MATYRLNPGALQANADADGNPFLLDPITGNAYTANPDGTFTLLYGTPPVPGVGAALADTSVQANLSGMPWYGWGLLAGAAWLVLRKR